MTGHSGPQHCAHVGEQLPILPGSGPCPNCIFKPVMETKIKSLKGQNLETYKLIRRKYKKPN